MKRVKYIILVPSYYRVYKERILQILLSTTLVLKPPTFVFTYNRVRGIAFLHGLFCTIYFLIQYTSCFVSM